jgi:uncharacterized protein
MPDSSPVTFHSGDEPEIVAASQQARKTFRYFWNQLSLDFNRIVPALELACLKVPFSESINGEMRVEQMWVDQVNFDGVSVTGILINAPNWLTSVQQGDEVMFPITQISDWLCVLDGQVYGAYTIQVLRSHMDEEERASHDAAWGLEFPAPSNVLIPERNMKFENVIASLLEKQIEEDSSIVSAAFDEGRTVLHLESLYGRDRSVQVLLEHGADVSVRCDRGWTARDYAQSLQWDHIVALLDQQA